jgi:hypothetical protein
MTIQGVGPGFARIIRRAIVIWREGSESDRAPPDLDQRPGLASKSIAKC